ncbi:MAG: archease [Gemmatimonadota bacterium]|nr:MAG: archease [Gemmatimonadota bacterium]
MSESSWRWWTIEHTADLAMEIEAPSLELLFLAGGHGLVGVLCGRETGCEGPEVRSTSWRELVLEATDPEVLFVDWLRELLYIQTREGMVFSGAEIEKLDERCLFARAGFRDPGADSEIERELKGVTYHDLRVERRDGKWHARVVFDL